MLLIISPAKTMNYHTPLATNRYSEPEFTQYSEQLVDIAKKIAPAQLERLMNINPKIAATTAKEFANWSIKATPNNARPAILAYDGEVYRGLDAYHFNEDDFSFAQQHLRMISGLYGLLRPLDLIEPYRLEIITKLANPKGDTLYAFWQNIVTEALSQAIQQQNDDILLNLASDEYYKVIDTDKLSATIVKVVFLDEKAGHYKVISVYAKKARGLLSRFVIKNRCKQLSDLQSFDYEGYHFDKNESNADHLVFKRAEQDRPH